jgi:hypothetical protein
MNNAQRLAITLAALLFAVVVGGFAYHAGIANGIAQSAKIVVAAPAAGAPAPYYPYPYYGWHHPWGFGFFFVPFLFFIFFMMILRAIFWSGAWHRRGGTCGGGFSEWHRREHEQMSNEGRTGP